MVAETAGCAGYGHDYEKVMYFNIQITKTGFQGLFFNEGTILKMLFGILKYLSEKLMTDELNCRNSFVL
jgi:hypothetical protein